MKKAKSASRRTFWWTVFIVLVVVGLVDTAIWFGFHLVGAALSPLMTSTAGGPVATSAVESFQSLEQIVFLYGLPASFLLFVLVVAVIRGVYRSHLAAAVVQSAKPAKRTDSKDASTLRAEKRIQDQRLFLHLISVLQRKGRLIDFFAEDLTPFDDAQIGAAVREIHGTCRGIVEKSIALAPVIDQIEGETVTVEAGFDPHAVKLVGNVAGEPPFSGVLRHRGWRAGKLELPTLSGTQDPAIIAPAEVEIQ